MIEHHVFRALCTQVQNGVMDGKRLLPEPSDDSSCQLQVLPKNGGFSHLALNGQHIVVPLPLPVPLHIRRREVADAAMYAVLLAVFRIVRTGPGETAGDDQTAIETSQPASPAFAFMVEEGRVCVGGRGAPGEGATVKTRGRDVEATTGENGIFETAAIGDIQCEDAVFLSFDEAVRFDPCDLTDVADVGEELRARVGFAIEPCHIWLSSCVFRNWVLADSVPWIETPPFCVRRAVSLRTRKRRET